MVKKFLLLFLLACGPTLKERAGDCVTNRIRSLSHAKTDVSQSFYEEIVSDCNKIYTGRP